MRLKEYTVRPLNSWPNLVDHYNFQLNVIENAPNLGIKHVIQVVAQTDKPYKYDTKSESNKTSAFSTLQNALSGLFDKIDEMN
jgi:hypothetical protein